MPYTFRLIMGGLCMFAVDESDPDKKVVHALMVETDEKKIKKALGEKAHDRLSVMKTELGHVPEVHAPVLIYPFKALAGVPPGVSDRQGQWLLRGEEISIRVANPAPLDIVGNLNDTKSGTAANDDLDFTWVPELSTVLGKDVTLDSDVLAKAPSKGFLSARVRVDHGTLSVDQFAQWKGGDVQVDFAPGVGGSIARQVIPHRVAWEIEVPDEPGPDGALVPGRIEIQSLRFEDAALETAAPTTILSFQPSTPPKDDFFEVMLVNLCCGDYLSEEATPPETLEPDLDFLCFYMLTDNFAKLAEEHHALPIPVGAKLETPQPGGGASGINCSMARDRRPKGGA